MKRFRFIHTLSLIVAAIVITGICRTTIFAQSIYVDDQRNTIVDQFSDSASSATTILPAQTGNAPAPATVSVSAEQLSAVGFDGVIIQPPSDTRFPDSVFYFRVQNLPQNAILWGDAANLVAILVAPIHDTTWNYHNGTMEILDMGSRIQVRISVPGYYIVLTGPDEQRIMNLANTLKLQY